MAAREIVEVTEPGRGGAAGYTVCHALKLLELASTGRIGRPMIERTLGLGEASARSLLRRLRDAGLLEVHRGGHIATEKASAYTSLLEHVRCSKLPRHESIPWPDAVMVATDLLPPPSTLVDVYRLRDYLVEEGCRSCIIAGVSDGRIVVPGIDESEVPGLKEHLAMTVPEEIEWENAVIVIVPEACKWQACSALLRAYADSCRSPQALHD